MKQNQRDRTELNRGVLIYKTGNNENDQTYGSFKQKDLWKRNV